jgi:DNA-directed RNA polymerase specialized sigma subunit
MTIEERNKLIVNYIPLANKIAYQKNKTTPKNIDFEELKSVAYLGLIDAANKFNLEHSCSFATYARFRIIGSIKDYLRKSKLKLYKLQDNYFFCCDYDNLDLFSHVLSFLDCTGQNIIKMYYIDNKSMKQIADSFGVTESRISQLINKYKKIIKGKIK